MEKGVFPEGVLYHTNRENSDNRIGNLEDLSRVERASIVESTITARAAKKEKKRQRMLKKL